MMPYVRLPESLEPDLYLRTAACKWTCSTSIQYSFVIVCPRTHNRQSLGRGNNQSASPPSVDKVSSGTATVIRLSATANIVPVTLDCNCILKVGLYSIIRNVHKIRHFIWNSMVVCKLADLKHIWLLLFSVPLITNASRLYYMNRPKQNSKFIKANF